jgi:hypothetical protein
LGLENWRKRCGLKIFLFTSKLKCSVLTLTNTSRPGLTWKIYCPVGFGKKEKKTWPFPRPLNFPFYFKFNASFLTLSNTNRPDLTWKIYCPFGFGKKKKRDVALSQAFKFSFLLQIYGIHF